MNISQLIYFVVYFNVFMLHRKFWLLMPTIIFLYFVNLIWFILWNLSSCTIIPITVPLCEEESALFWNTLLFYKCHFSGKKDTLLAVKWHYESVWMWEWKTGKKRKEKKPERQRELKRELFCLLVASNEPPHNHPRWQQYISATLFLEDYICIVKSDPCFACKALRLTALLSAVLSAAYRKAFRQNGFLLGIRVSSLVVPYIYVGTNVQFW